jgi:uncharacterized integral membrane protein
MATLYLACSIALLTLVVALQNTTPVMFRVLFWQYDASLLLVILAAVVQGFCIACFLAVAPVWRRARRFEYLSMTVVSQGARIRRLQGELRSAGPTEEMGPLLPVRSALVLQNLSLNKVGEEMRDS